MSLQDTMRDKVKEMKYKNNIKYNFIAIDILSMNYQSFLHWLNKKYDFGEEKQRKLKDFIETTLDIIIK